LEDTSIKVDQVQLIPLPNRLPSIGLLRAVEVKYTSSTGAGALQCVVKEPRGTTRTGLAGAGRREAGVYRSLNQYLPLTTPALIAASPIGDWLVLELLQAIRGPSEWEPNDYITAIDALSRLHDRFWGLETDLGVYAWLSRPLRADFEVHVTVAAKAIERIVSQAQPGPLADVPERMQVLAALTMHADQVVEPLLQQPSTLLHGDYWPGNITIVGDGQQMVYDWQLTGTGPGVIDLLVFVNKSEWWFDQLPLSREELIDHYRNNMATAPGVRWNKKEWELLWDHALMWRFLQEWVDLLAASPDPLLETRADQLDQVWLEPVARAVSRRLEVM
jgi:hypothetical protein